ncbi:hypothetical protein NX059_011542 [Plenodomus lindquistii]|nr:hypothetical protein NX059_011542 [Plenodomus lindquistii]
MMASQAVDGGRYKYSNHFLWSSFQCFSLQFTKSCYITIMSFNQGGFAANTPTVQTEFQSESSAQDGFNSEGFSQGGFQQQGFFQSGFQQEGFSQGGFRDENGNVIPQTVSFDTPTQRELKPTPPRPIKRIIICCDGTWQSSAHGAQTVPSNVAKISRSIDSWYVDANGLMAPQLVYYDAGVGTAMGNIESKLMGAYGGGLDENVCEAYNFLVNNYSKGDELFFFGFSRGAYTVRACAGLVCRVGICQPSSMGQFWEMYSIYKAMDADKDIRKTEWYTEWVKTGNEAEDTFTVKVRGEDWKFPKGGGRDWLDHAEREDVKIKVVGVWDTVGSLGYPDNVYMDMMTWNKPFAFHNTDIHEQVENAFHALALDEHRKSFTPTLWSLPEGSKTNLIQCWFPGVHINVGGGSGDGKKDLERGIGNEDGPKKAVHEDDSRSRGDLEIMSITTFFWMVDRCNPFLRFKIDYSITRDYVRALNVIADRAKAAESGSHSGDPKTKHYGGWGIGPILDSYKGIMAAAGSAPRTPGHYFVDREHAEEHDKNNHHKVTNEFMHPVIQHAIKQIDYQPEALEGFERKSIKGGLGHHWVKTYRPSHPGLLKRGWSYITGRAVPSDTQDDLVVIPEFVIPEAGFNERGMYWWPYERELITMAQNRQVKGGFVPQEEQTSMEDRKTDLEGTEFLMELDEANKNMKEMRAWKKQVVTSSNSDYEMVW